MKFVSKVVEIEAEKIVKVSSVGSPIYEVETDAGNSLPVVSSQEIRVGDYLNVTDPADIYHMPARIVEGPDAKYTPVSSTKDVNAKSLGNTCVNGAKKSVSDLVVFGNGDMFKLLSKASSQNEGWMKSTKAMDVGNGCVVQVTTQQRNPDGSYAIAEALTFVPGVCVTGNSSNWSLVLV